MSQLFLLPNQMQSKMLKFIEQFLLKQGLDFKIVNSHQDAIDKIQECFKVEERSIVKIKPLRVRGFILNPENRILSYKKIKILLRKKEFELFHFMLLNHGAIIDRNTILERVWGQNSNPFTNTVDVHMSHLRKKLMANNIDVIKTVHSAGYKLEI
jgi:DNA-binding response OmpR family regulator